MHDIFLWNLETNKKKLIIHREQPITAVAVSPDGTYFVFADKAKQAPITIPGRVLLIFLPDKTRLWKSDFEGNIQLLPNTDKLVGDILTLQVSENNIFITTMSLIYIYTPSAPETLHNIPISAPGTPYDLRESIPTKFASLVIDNGKKIIIGTSKGYIRMYETATGKFILGFDNKRGGPIQALAITHDMQHLFFADSSIIIRLTALTKNSVPQEIGEAPLLVNSLKVALNNNYLAGISYVQSGTKNQGVIVLWKPNSLAHFCEHELAKTETLKGVK